MATASSSSSADKLSSADRDTICKALELYGKSLERAQRANTGAIADAFGAAAKSVEVLGARMRTLSLEF